MSESIRVALVEPIPALQPLFERVIAATECELWLKGDEVVPDLVVLGLDSPDPGWAITVERWLAKGVPVIASAIRAESFSLVGEHPASVQALDRPFTPLQLKGALAISADLVRASALVEAPTTAEGLMAVPATLSRPAGDDQQNDGLDDEDFDVTEIQVAELDLVEYEPEQSLSGDVEVVTDIDRNLETDVALSEEQVEIRVAEAIAEVLDEVAALPTREERVAMLRYLIQTA